MAVNLHLRATLNLARSALFPAASGLRPAFAGIHPGAGRVIPNYFFSKISIGNSHGSSSGSGSPRLDKKQSSEEQKDFTQFRAALRSLSSVKNKTYGFMAAIGLLDLAFCALDFDKNLIPGLVGGIILLAGVNFIGERIYNRKVKSAEQIASQICGKYRNNLLLQFPAQFKKIDPLANKILWQFHCESYQKSGHKKSLPQIIEQVRREPKPKPKPKSKPENK